MLARDLRFELIFEDVTVLNASLASQARADDLDIASLGPREDQPKRSVLYSHSSRPNPRSGKQLASRMIPPSSAACCAERLTSISR